MSIRRHVHFRTLTQACTHTCTLTHTYTYAHTCTHACIHMCMHVCTSTHARKLMDGVRHAEYFRVRLLRWTGNGIPRDDCAPPCSGDYEPAVQPDSPSSSNSTSTFNCTTPTRSGDSVVVGSNQKRLVERVHSSELLVGALDEGAPPGAQMRALICKCAPCFCQVWTWAVMYPTHGALLHTK